MPKQIRKRDGRVVPFDPERIRAAIGKALEAVNADDGQKARKLCDDVVEELKGFDKIRKGAGKPTIPGVENVQDVVEKVLIESGEADAAKAYILYRKSRAELRGAKESIGVKDDMKLTLNAIKVLERRYLLKDDSGRVVETPSQLFRRVAHAVAQADLNYADEKTAQKTGEEFYRMMTNFEFLPNSPTLMNAGTEMGQLSACFVLPVNDSMEEIFTSLRDMALIHQSGGGTGFSFSRLRPKGDLVRSTHGVASGPVSFMLVFDAATEVVKQGGRRRGANMGILRVDHPDILDFATVKAGGDKLKNFNISVAVDDGFMQALATNSHYDIVNPRTGKSGMSLKAADVFEVITTSAWKCGDPGLCFIDEINRFNPVPQLGAIETTNPCGEQPLQPYESCNLGSINLSAMVRDGKLDEGKLVATVKCAVHFLDNVIDVSKFALPRVREATLGNRKTGLGVMGLAEMLVKLGLAYNSDEAVKCAGATMKLISGTARAASAELAEKRGSFPNFEKSIWPSKGFKSLRNATVTSIAPTGTISIIAGCSSGIEPLFSLSYYRHVMENAHLLEKNALFEEIARREGFYSEQMMAEIARKGSLEGIPGVPDEVGRLFVTAFDIAPEWHVKMQAAFQKHTDNGVSKTVNLRQDATQADVRRIYLLAHQLRCKGITIYRYGSRPGQVLTIDESSQQVCE